ncbi:hypothetical protein [Nitrosomonas eutropha]|uniref:hypothetical protein n=1 Tax=Nitrosomonas eutropha TaxID=916 RepID=UPI001A91C161|nr:hypothetical protein [Nitrosomonas eutropha]
MSRSPIAIVSASLGAGVVDLMLVHYERVMVQSSVCQWSINIVVIKRHCCHL